MQCNAYQQVVHDLRTGRKIDETPKLIKLTPYLDRHGLMCVGGRIEKAPLPIDVRHPTILPRSERETEFILFKLRRDRSHLSASQLHHEARKQYWIPQRRTATQRVYRLCYRRRRLNAKGRTPFKAALPASRLKVG